MEKLLRKFKNMISASISEVQADKVSLDSNSMVPIGLLDIPSDWLSHAFYRNLSAGNPNYILIDIAQLLHNTGQHELAQKYYESYLKIHPNKAIHGLYLQCLLHSDNATNEFLLKKHQEWVALYEKHEPSVKLQNSLDSNKRIRVGYLCHFFGNSISKHCLLPVLEAHNMNEFEIFCYDDGETAEVDKNPKFIWRDIRDKTDAEVTELIRNDQIDVLQEANGFCLINRFGVVANRAAPVQINWYNHNSTTSIKGMDYVMADEISIPLEDDIYFTEKVYRNNGFIGALNLSHNNLPLERICPVQKNKYITFSYFGGGHKITESAIALWAKVLNSIPNSKMIIKGGAMDQDISRNVFLKLFKQHGILKNRLILLGFSSQLDTLERYNSVDIMLDVTTHTGGTTMFEALWQGVPVISLRGKRWASRSGASVLDRLNCPELIAENNDDFVEKAIRLANDLPLLQSYRHSLREKMEKSSLVDIPLFSRNLEKGYRYMWQQWCRENLHHQ